MIEKTAVLMTKDGRFYDLLLAALDVDKAPILLRYGGGLFVRHEDIALTVATGMVVYLQVTPVDIPEGEYLLEPSTNPWARMAEIVEERGITQDA
jgi:hypothetical protein